MCMPSSGRCSPTSVPAASGRSSPTSVMVNSMATLKQSPPHRLPPSPNNHSRAVKHVRDALSPPRVKGTWSRSDRFRNAIEIEMRLNESMRRRRALVQSPRGSPARALSPNPPVSSSPGAACNLRVQDFRSPPPHPPVSPLTAGKGPRPHYPVSPLTAGKGPPPHPPVSPLTVGKGAPPPPPVSPLTAGKGPRPHYPVSPLTAGNGPPPHPSTSPPTARKGPPPHRRILQPHKCLTPHQEARTRGESAGIHPLLRSPTQSPMHSPRASQLSEAAELETHTTLGAWPRMRSAVNSDLVVSPIWRTRQAFYCW